MEYLSVGEIYPKFATGNDALVLEYNQDSGFSLLVMLNGMTDDEVCQFGTDVHFTIGAFIYDRVAYFSFKFGKMNWMDAPFNPCIYAEVGEKVYFPVLNEDEGYPLNIYLIDSSTGELKNIRLIGLGHDFSTSFRKWATDETADNMTKSEYQEKVRFAYDHFGPEDFAGMADWMWKLIPENIDC